MRSGNLMVYYEQGNPKKCVVPDAFIAKGVEVKRRRTYKIWGERKTPDAVIETTSRKTRRKDTVEKPQLYARLGVKEYFLFDPFHEYLDPPLQGYRLDGDSYVRIAADASGRLESQELGLRLCPEGATLQFYQLDTGERLLDAGRACPARSRSCQTTSRSCQTTSRSCQAPDRTRGPRRARSRDRQATGGTRRARG